MLPDEKLSGEVEGVERAREGSQLRLVNLEAHHLAHAELHPVQPNRTVLFEMRQHEEERQFGRELALGFLRFNRFFRLRNGGSVRLLLRSAFDKSFDQLSQFVKSPRMVLGDWDDAASQQGGDSLGRQD